MFYLLLCAALTPQDPVKEGLTSKEMTEAKDLVRQAFAAKPADRAAILEKLEAIDHPSKNDVNTLSKLALQLARVGPTVDFKKSDQKCTHPDYPGTYVLSAPDSARKKATGLFIGLHGRGGNGLQAAGAWGPSLPADLITVFPTVMDVTDFWQTEREMKFVLAILDDLKRSYVIDTNRVYLGGHSMGGFGTWAIGTENADLFAALGSGAGGLVMQDALPNLKNTPIWFFHSKDDTIVGDEYDVKAAKTLEELKTKHGPFDFTWKYYTDISHGLPKEGIKPIVDWMTKKTRSPWPKHLLWTGAGRHFWLARPKAGGLVEAKVEGNTISITGDADGLEILLSDELVKLKDPVVVKVDGAEKHNAKVKLSLVALVESALRNDPERIAVARIKL